MKKLQYLFMSLAAMLLATPAFAQGAKASSPEPVDSARCRSRHGARGGSLRSGSG